MSLADETTVVFPHRRWLLIKQEYHSALLATVRSRAAWFFGALLLLALALLVLKGRMDIIIGAAQELVLIPALALLTIPLTIRVNRLPPLKTNSSRTQLWWQTGILLLIVLLAAYRNLVLFAPNAPKIPGLYTLAYTSIYFLGVSNRPPGNLVSVPLLYIIIPLLLFFVMALRWSEIGFGRGYHSWRVALLWCVFPVLLFVKLIMNGAVASVTQFLQHLLRAVLQNGFSEEFLFRGALLTRLSFLLRPDWALVLSAVLYGLFSTGVQAGAVGGDWVVAMASTILIQAVIGLGTGFLLQRTRNLLAPTLFQVAWDMYTAFT
jgi:membrane protease YdiL (CAAX protease family)